MLSNFLVWAKHDMPLDAATHPIRRSQSASQEADLVWPITTHAVRIDYILPGDESIHLNPGFKIPFTEFEQLHSHSKL